MKKGKKVLFAISPICLLLSLTSCTLTDIKDIGDITSKGGDVLSKINVSPNYLKSAVTSADYLTGGEVTVTQETSSGEVILPIVEVPSVETPIVAEDQVLSVVKGYINLAESILSIPSRVVTNASDKEEYTTMTTYTNISAEGTTTTYIVYMKEVADVATISADIESSTSSNSTEVLPPSSSEVVQPSTDSGVEVPDVELPEEIEQNSTITGLLIKDGISYRLEGKKEIEGEGKWQETKITLKTINLETPENYLELVQETENNEIEYTYKEYVGGELVAVTEIETKTKLNKICVEITTEIAGVEKTFEVEKKISGVNTFYTFEIEEGETTIKIWVKQYLDKEGKEVLQFSYRNDFGEIDSSKDHGHKHHGKEDREDDDELWDKGHQNNGGGHSHHNHGNR